MRLVTIYPFFEYPDIEIKQGWINQICLQVIFLHPGYPAEKDLLYSTEANISSHFFLASLQLQLNIFSLQL